MIPDLSIMYPHGATVGVCAGSQNADYFLKDANLFLNILWVRKCAKCGPQVDHFFHAGLEFHPRGIFFRKCRIHNLCLFRNTVCSKFGASSRVGSRPEAKEIKCNFLVCEMGHTITFPCEVRLRDPARLRGRK